MSSEKQVFEKKIEYIERLVEVGGTKQPAELAERLGISYQAAKNYLQGRLPDTNVLLNISQRTSYSIHWILTGEGEKFVVEKSEANEILLSNKMKSLVRQHCLEIFNELFEDRKPLRQKVVKVSANSIKPERRLIESYTNTDKSSK